MTLILKQKHWKYTLISAVCILPLLATVAAATAVWAGDYEIARKTILFLLERSPWFLGVSWLLLPLVGVHLSHQAYERGTIDRWRPLNKFVRNSSILLIVTALVVSLVFAF